VFSLTVLVLKVFFFYTTEYMVFIVSAVLGSFAKLRIATISFFVSVSLSVCPYGIARLSLEGFS
jgi:hypothetical protein